MKTERHGHWAVLLVLSMAMPALGSETRVQLNDWSYSRERKTINASNKVAARLLLTNVTDQILWDVNVAITLNSSMGEKVAGPLTKILGQVKPGEKKEVLVGGLFIPSFDSYEVAVSYRGGEEKWISSSSESDPTPISNELLENVARLVLLGHELSPGRDGKLAGKLKVKNFGTVEAQDAKVRVTFYGPPPKTKDAPKIIPPAKKDSKGDDKSKGKSEDKSEDKEKTDEKPQPQAKVLAEWTGKLGTGTVKGGDTVLYQVVVPINCPKGYQRLVVSVNSKELAAENQMSGGDFQNIADVEAARWKFERTGKDKDVLEIACVLRNGLDVAVQRTSMVLTFFKQVKGKKTLVNTCKQELPGLLEPGKETELKFKIEKMPEFESYEQALEYEKAGGNLAQQKGREKKNDPSQAQNFLCTNTVEVLLKEFVTKEDGTVMVACSARNGRSLLVKDVEVHAEFLKKDGSILTTALKKLSDPMSPGEVRNFILHAPGAHGYAEVKSKINFIEVRSTQKTPDEAGDQAARGEEKASAAVEPQHR